jgi:hypothetical protein
MNIADGEEGDAYFISVRVEKTLNEGSVYTYGGAAEWLFRPPYSRELAEQAVREKLALLVLAPVGLSVKGVGRKLGSSPEVYYVRMFAEDLEKIKEEQDDLRLRG